MKATHFTETTEESGEEEMGEPDYAAENAEANLQFFKKQLESINKKIAQNREKLVYLRKVYQQFAMLVSKTVADNYGVIEKPIKIEKPSPISLPPSNSQMNAQLMHLLTKTDSVSPSDVVKFVNNFSIVERLIFTNQSAFDDNLLNALFRSSPDIRIAFFNTISTKLLRCNKFLSDLLPVLSKLSLHPALRKQSTDPYAKFSDFFNFFEESKAKIGELLGFKLVLNEFVAFQNLGQHLASLDYRTGLMLSIAMAGFANVSSMGICISGISILCPDKRPVLARLAFKAMIGGFAVSILSAMIVGFITII